MFFSLSLSCATMCGGVNKQKTHNRLLVMGSSCDELRDAFI
jgi:hypothetical protein